MQRNKPSTVPVTPQAKKRALAIAATDPTGTRVHAAENILGTKEIKETYVNAQEKLSKQTDGVAAGMKAVKDKKNGPELGTENKESNSFKPK